MDAMALLSHRTNKQKWYVIIKSCDPQKFKGPTA